jgi:hypothetical protein
MNPTQSSLAPLDRPDLNVDPDTVALRRITRTSALDPECSLRCLSSGYLKDGRSCGSTIPLGVARAAWNRESERAGARRDGYFHFAWNGRVWLGFGLANGRVRGVYCPEHAAERDSRSSAQAASA